MNKVTLVVLSLAVGGCSSFNKDEKLSSPTQANAVVNTVKVEDKTSHKIQPNHNFQRMSTSFNRKGLKMEWSCSPKAQDCISPEIIAIEAIGYATTNGSSENSRDSAFTLAELRAKAKLRKFIYEEISTSTVTKVITKNIERLNEKFEANTMDDAEISVDSDDVNASPNKSNTLRLNNNNTVRQITETIKSNASGILRGVQVIDESMINTNNVSVTIRWDRSVENVGNYLGLRFGN